MKKVDKETRIQREEEYVDFLTKRLASEHYRSNVTAEEFEETKKKLSKAKLVLKVLRT